VKTDFYYLVLFLLFLPVFLPVIKPGFSLVFTITSLFVPVYYFSAVATKMSTGHLYSFMERTVVCPDKKLVRSIPYIVTCNILLMISVRS